jgi:hypothetical protein
MLRCFTLFSLFISFAWGQKPSLYYSKKQTEIGSRTDLKPVQATTFSFSAPFYDAFYDSTTSRLFFSTRAKDPTGKVFSNNAFQYCLDVTNDSILWINDVKKYDISRINDYLFFSGEEKTSRFNKKSGFEQYEYPSKIVFTDAKNKIGLSFNKLNSINSVENLKCISLDDGNLKWSCDITRQFDWNEARYLNDSILLIAASGLHGVNIKNGTTWSHPLITGDDKMKKFVFSPITEESSTLGKASFVSSPLESVVTQISSNILVEEDRIYFAGKDKLICVNHSGKLIWSSDISVSPTGKSFLFINGNDISLFNLGVAAFKERIVDYGKPYLIGMNKMTGAVNFNQSLSIFNSPVDFKISNGTLFVSTREKMYQFNIANGDMLFMLEFNERQYGRFQGFVDGDNYFVEKEGFYVSLNFINDKSTYFMTDHGKIYGLEKNEIAYEYQVAELFELDKKYKNVRLLNQKDNTWVVSKNWELMAKLKTGTKVIIANNKLYYPVGRLLHVIRLNDL